MYPYRRHGPKKRVKPGSPHNARGPQRGLPSGARELLPLLQPATKALAQVLAGRTASSGQLGHARSILAHAERLIGERAHNRLNPSEREEFFEQLARLRLTLTDADVEAEVQAAEDEVPSRPVVPVAQARLKEMALALSGSDRPMPLVAIPTTETVRQAPASNQAPRRPRPSSAPVGAPPAPRPERGGASADSAQPPIIRERVATPPPVAASAPGEQATPSEQHDRRPQRPARRQRNARAAPAAPSAPPPLASSDGAESAAPPANAGNGRAERASPEPSAPEPAAARRRKRAKQGGLPEGWVIDEEGFVVPGAS